MQGVGAGWMKRRRKGRKEGRKKEKRECTAHVWPIRSESSRRHPVWASHGVPDEVEEKEKKKAEGSHAPGAFFRSCLLATISCPAIPSFPFSFSHVHEKVDSCVDSVLGRRWRAGAKTKSGKRGEKRDRDSRGPLSEVAIDFSNSPWVPRRLTQSDFLRQASPGIVVKSLWVWPYSGCVLLAQENDLTHWEIVFFLFRKTLFRICEIVFALKINQLKLLGIEYLLW